MLPLRDAKISRYARYGKKTAPNLLSEVLAHSVTAIFVPLGCSDSYRTKKKWETFAFIEGEPLTVNVQIGKLGAALPANC